MGTPIKWLAYDYPGHGRDNLAFGDLLTATTKRLARQYPNLRYFSTVELQARFSPHAHILLRVEQSDATLDDSAIKRAVLETSVRGIDGVRVAWGREIEVRLLQPDDRALELRARDLQRGPVTTFTEAAKYVLKATTKFVSPLSGAAEQHLRQIERAIEDLSGAAGLHRRGQPRQTLHSRLGLPARGIRYSQPRPGRVGWTRHGDSMASLQRERVQAATFDACFQASATPTEDSPNPMVAFARSIALTSATDNGVLWIPSGWVYKSQERYETVGHSRVHGRLDLIKGNWNMRRTAQGSHEPDDYRQQPFSVGLNTG